MTTFNHRFSRQKIQLSGGRHILRRSLTRPASITAVTSRLRASSQMAFTTRATSGIACVHPHASPSNGFALRWSDIARFSSRLMTTPATGFQPHRSGLIRRIPSLALSRSASWSPLIHYQRTSTFSIPRSRGLSCTVTSMTARDGFVAQLEFGHERSNTHARLRTASCCPGHWRNGANFSATCLLPVRSWIVSSTTPKPLPLLAGATSSKTTPSLPERRTKSKNKSKSNEPSTAEPAI